MLSVLEEKLMFRSLAFTLLLVSTSALASDSMPRLDIQSTCNAATPLVPQDRSPRETCMRDEGEAQSQLERQWSSFAAPARQQCVEETNIGGYPSYVELLTCLQIRAGNAQTPSPSPTIYRRPGR